MLSTTFPREHNDELERALQGISTQIEQLKTASSPDDKAINKITELLAIIYDISLRCQFIKKLLGHDTYNQDAAILSIKLATLRILSKNPQQNEDRIRSIAHEIRNSLQFISYFISSLTFWGEGREEMPLVRVALKDFFERAVPRFQNSAFIPITVDIDKNDIAFMHEGTIFTLILNICRNASVHGKAKKCSINIAERNEDTIVIEISDDGAGIADAIAGRIFELGFSGSGGSGLGLGDGKKRLEIMGGDIRCEPHSGLENKHDSRGAKFVLSLRTYP